ncbi:plasminogen receptor (KT) [Sitodiplosis mosellana]|uniref:plasminogen receptor (KT) n=1 Tax=Sitodiplosis mosellana TaxID=263140 RepID=UPI0024447059|nr:plasminogen receptor (KT) [Sitodiplosis mosellana]
MGNTKSNQKNQEHISEMNRIKMERWIQMHYQIKERERALEISKNRELFYWLGAFYNVSLVGLLYRYKVTKRTTNLMAVVPLTFALAYYADLAYGSKLYRIRAEADMIMQNESDLLEWPHGLPTVSSIDQARINTEMEKKLHPSTP